MASVDDFATLYIVTTTNPSTSDVRLNCSSVALWERVKPVATKAANDFPYPMDTDSSDSRSDSAFQLASAMFDALCTLDIDIVLEIDEPTVHVMHHLATRDEHLRGVRRFANILYASSKRTGDPDSVVARMMAIFTLNPRRVVKELKKQFGILECC